MFRRTNLVFFNCFRDQDAINDARAQENLRLVVMFALGTICITEYNMTSLKKLAARKNYPFGHIHINKLMQ